MCIKTITESLNYIKSTFYGEVDKVSVDQDMERRPELIIEFQEHSR